VNNEERQLLIQDIGLCLIETAKHMIEAAPCLCEKSYVRDDGEVAYYTERYKCNRCNKLEELK